MIIHYYGNDTLGRVRPPHGNVSRHNRPFVRTAKRTIKIMHEKVSLGIRPQRAYEETKQLVEKEVREHNADFEALKPAIAPRNVRRAQNLNYAENKKKITYYQIYSVQFMQACDFADYVKKLIIGPDLLVVFGDTNAIEFGNRLLKASSRDRSLEQLVSYDTTFNLGDFYVSILVMQNTELKGDPIFPVLFLLHQRKYKEVHYYFWRYHVTNLLKINEYGVNVPIVTDREMAHKNAVTANTSGNLIICHNHLLQDIKSMCYPFGRAFFVHQGSLILPCIPIG